MSAWIVSKGHIDALVQAMVVEGIIPMAEATATGKMLWEENHLSINARYREDEHAPEYTFEGIEAPLDDFIIMKQAGCYDYQTCEHGGWDASKARELILALEDVLIARNGGNPQFHYETKRNLPWGIDHIREAVLV